MTDSSRNPIRGCTRISPGCAHCYAEKFAERFRGVPGHPYEQGVDLRLIPGKLAEPFRRKVPSRIFVNSTSDLFHEGVPDVYLSLLWVGCGGGGPGSPSDGECPEGWPTGVEGEPGTPSRNHLQRPLGTSRYGRSSDSPGDAQGLTEPGAGTPSRSGVQSEFDMESRTDARRQIG